MGGLWPWFLTVCGLIVAVAGTELTGDKDDELSLTEELASDGVWKFTCDEYCAFCGCVGQFLRDEDKCVCSCEPSTADFDCLEDVRQTKEFLGLNYTLEIREVKPNPLEDSEASNLRIQRQISPAPSPRRRPGRRMSRPGRAEPRSPPNPVRPHRRPRERRPFHRREPLEPTSP
nr:uncharacterized protein LOC115254156 [Aedes albopictus]